MDAPSVFFTRPEGLIHSSESGFSVVFKASKDGRFRAYKTLKPEYRGDSMFESLLRKEFEIGYGLDHPNICKVLDFVEDEEHGHCIEMEWIDGRTLSDLASSGPLNKAFCNKVICEICDALEYVHRKQIIHRDLKPENILITNNGQNVKIIDFGLSDSDDYYIHKEPAGTRIYASPEQLNGQILDARSDIYSLGVIIGEVGAKWYSHVAARCLRRQPAKRFQSAAQVRRAINRQSSALTVWLPLLIVTLLAAAVIAFTDKSGDRNDRIFDAATQSIIDAQ